MRVGAAVAVAVFVVLAAGCGGKSSARLSHDAFVEQADTICDDLQAKQKGLTSPATLAAIPAYADRALRCSTAV